MTSINGINAENINNLLLKIRHFIYKNQIASIVIVTALVALIVSGFLFTNINSYIAIDFKDENLSAFDSEKQLIKWLDKNNYKYKFNSKDNLVYVYSADYPKIYQKLNDSQEVSTNNKLIGFELLDKARSFGSSQFMESIRYRRALEGELARTISGMSNIKSARVHLAIPKKTAFIRDITPASASVFIRTEKEDNFDSDIVESITSLIATSITGMKIENVTVVDQNGNLLSENKNSSLPIKQEKLKHRYQEKLVKEYSAEINNVLIPFLGKNHFTVTVDVNLKFINNNIKQDQHLDNIINTKYGDLKIINITSMILLGNKELSTNNNINISQPYSKQDLLKVENLIKSVVAFDQKRGDMVFVDNSILSNKLIKNPNGTIPVTNNISIISLVILALLFVYLFKHNKSTGIKNKIVLSKPKNKGNNKIKDKDKDKDKDNRVKSLNELSDEDIFYKIKNTHMQVQMIILSILEPYKASNVLLKFRKTNKLIIITKFFILDRLNIESIKKIYNVIETKLEIKIPEKFKLITKFDGIKAISGILFFADLSDNNLLNEVKEYNSRIAEKIFEKLFYFEDLINLEDSDCKLLLKNISMKNLLHSLKGCDPVILNKFINNLDKNISIELKEKLDSYSPVKISEVEFAQREILKEFAKLVEQKKVELFINLNKIAS